MIVGIDTRPLTYQLTGIGFYLKHVLDELQKFDHRNYYVLISNGPIKYLIKNKRWSKFEGKFKIKLFSTFWMQIIAPIIVKKRRIDLFWGPRHHLPLMIPNTVKTVLTVHDIVNRIYPGTMTLQNLLVERLLMSRSITTAHAIITDAASTISDIKKYFKLDPNKLIAIHPGVPHLPEVFDIGRTQPHIPEKYFLFVGTLDPRKNFHAIFNAFQKVHPENRKLHLVIVGGEGWKNNAFREMLAEHPLKNRVHLTGYVSRSELRFYYNNALCLLFPSLYEGFGFPILEAMSCGTPVITSRVSSMPEVAGDAALLVDPFDIGEIAAAMDKIVLDPIVRKQLSIEGYKRVKKFSWSCCARETLKVFEKVYAS